MTARSTSNYGRLLFAPSLSKAGPVVGATCAVSGRPQRPMSPPSPSEFVDAPYQPPVETVSRPRAPGCSSLGPGAIRYAPMACRKASEARSACSRVRVSPQGRLIDRDEMS